MTRSADPNPDAPDILDFFERRGGGRTRRGRTGDLCDLVDRVAHGRILDHEDDAEEDNPRRRPTKARRGWWDGRDLEPEEER